MSREPIYLSKEGREKLEKELRRLKTEERPRIVAEIARAMQMGDLSENAEYHAAKEEQEHIERRVGELEDKLSRVRSIDVNRIPTDKVYLFAKVLVKDLDRNEEITYHIKPPEESDVENNEISIKSPIGQALLGKGVGSKVKVKIPVGLLNYEILKIYRE